MAQHISIEILKIEYLIDYGTPEKDVPFLFPAVQKWTAILLPKRKENEK